LWKDGEKRSKEKKGGKGCYELCAAGGKDRTREEKARSPPTLGVYSGEGGGDPRLEEKRRSPLRGQNWFKGLAVDQKDIAGEKREGYSTPSLLKKKGEGRNFPVEEKVQQTEGGGPRGSRGRGAVAFSSSLTRDRLLLACRWKRGNGGEEFCGGKEINLCIFPDSDRVGKEGLAGKFFLNACLTMEERPLPAGKGKGGGRLCPGGGTRFIEGCRW